MAEPIEIAQADQVSIARVTGQPSKASKQRSSYNALKHGIFSDVTLLPGESGDKYRSLLKDLQETLQPEGRLEKLLVEKLASITWRYRRLLTAEGAEIRQGGQFVEWDQRDEERQKAGTNVSDAESLLDNNPSLIRDIHVPHLLDSCLESLRELREDIESNGFDEDRDTEALERVYGPDTPLSKTLFHTYLAWLHTAETPEEERRREGCDTPEQCKKNILAEIGEEIRRLRKYGRERASVESERTKLEVVRQAVPESVRLDRLLRYEASLERSFDRTLNQLERMQRLRRGQPVAPRIDVTVSS